MSEAFLSSFLAEGESIPLPTENIYFWLNYFEQYLESMEKFLEQESMTVRARFRGIPWERDNRLEALEDFFPDILRKSFFVATYSLIETELNERCRHAKLSKDLPLALGDLSGQGIKRQRNI